MNICSLCKSILHFLHRAAEFGISAGGSGYAGRSETFYVNWLTPDFRLTEIFIEFFRLSGIWYTASPLTNLILSAGPPDGPGSDVS